MCRAPSEKKNVVKHVNFSHILLKMHTVYWSYDTWAWETLVDIISADTEGVASWTEYMSLHRTLQPTRPLRPVMLHSNNYLEGQRESAEQQKRCHEWWK